MHACAINCHPPGLVLQPERCPLILRLPYPLVTPAIGQHVFWFHIIIHHHDRVSTDRAITAAQREIKVASGIDSDAFENLFGRQQL